MSGSPATSAPPDPGPVPDTLPAAVADLAAAERTASRRRSRQSAEASPELARLLASIAACEAAHAALLDDPSMTRPPAAVPVLQAALAAEHAVVFGYGVAGARLSGDARRRAQRGYDAHRARRDELAALLVERAAEPEPPAASYALPRPVEDARDAVELLTLLEERLAAVWADAVLELRR